MLDESPKPLNRELPYMTTATQGARRTTTKIATGYIQGPAAWASYLVNGDDSSLTQREKAIADTWAARQGGAIVDVDGEPYFSKHWDIYVPEMTALEGTYAGDLIQYVAHFR